MHMSPPFTFIVFYVLGGAPTHSAKLLNFLRNTWDLLSLQFFGPNLTFLPLMASGIMFACFSTEQMLLNVVPKASFSSAFHIVHLQFSSVAQLCPTLCDSMNCSVPGFPVQNQLPELAQTHVSQVDDAIQPWHGCHFIYLQSFPASGSFPMSQFFASGGQSIGASASAPVLLINIEG